MAKKAQHRTAETEVAAAVSAIIAGRLGLLIDPTQVRAKAREAGLNGAYIYEILIGRNKKPSVQAIQAIAKVTGTTVAYLVGETDDVSPNGSGHKQQIGTSNMPIIGVVEDSTFRKSTAETPVEGLRAPFSIDHPLARHFALEVRDNSMAASREHIEAGTWVLCVDMIDAGLVVSSGGIYAVRRTLDKGRTWETILRRAQCSKDCTQLSAEGHGTFENLAVPGRLGTDPLTEIYAFGLVYGAVRLFR